MLEKFTKKEHKKELRYFKEWYNEEIQFYILSYLLSYPNYHAVQKITTHAHEKCKDKPYYDDFWMVLYNIDYLEIKELIELEKKNVPDKDKIYRITSKGIDSLVFIL